MYLVPPRRRLKSVKNIEKITKSMKVVASTKLTRAERAMKQAKKYGAANEGESRVSFIWMGSMGRGRKANADGYARGA